MVQTTKSFAVAVLALVLLLVGLAGAYLSLIPPIVGFGLFAAGGALGLAAIVWGLVVKLRKTARGGALAVGIGAVPFLAVAVSAAMMMGKSGPGINDITTDTSDPPVFTASTEHGDYPEGFAEKATKAYPAVQPLTLPIAPAAAVTVASEVAEARGWTIVDSGADGFEAYELSSLFRFRDDIVVRVRAAASGSVVDVRSASRDGKADFGVNAARIESFLAAVGKRVL